jgi:arginase
MRNIIIHNLRYLDENPLFSLKNANLLNKLKEKGFNVKTCDKIKIEITDNYRDSETKILGIESWKKLSKDIVKELTVANFNNEFHLLIGGDCSNLLGITGYFKLQNKEIGLICLDAHSDFRLPEDSLTGEPADIEIAVVTGTGPEKITKLFRESPIIKEENVLLLGIREVDHIDRSNISYVKCEEIRGNLKNIILDKIAILLEKKIPIWVHLDVDVLDPKIMPVHYPVPNGLTFNEIFEIFVIIIENLNLLGMSVGCYHPQLDKTEDSTKKLSNLLFKIVEKLILSQP